MGGGGPSRPDIHVGAFRLRRGDATQHQARCGAQTGRRRRRLGRHRPPRGQALGSDKDRCPDGALRPMMHLRRPSIEALLTFAFIAIGLLWGGFLADQHLAGRDRAFSRLEYLTLDWRFLLAGSRPAPRGVVIAAVDDDALREAGSYPLPRDVLARIVRELAAHGPQVIAIDILFIDPGKPDADAALADALRASPAVVAAVGLFDGDRAGADGRLDLSNSDVVPAPSDVLWPIAAVRSAARIGL